jgi:tetratricopeptide (TPR) repeat protein
VAVPLRSGVSPQARGRELAREGTQLWRERGSVTAAAAELVNRHPDVPCLQAFRYACGLSQDQAAARYNEVTAHRTSVGGTTINAWETWARRRRAGSPPAFGSLLTLATAYGGGPLGVAEEHVSPGDLIAGNTERLSPEDQLALKAHAAIPRPAQPADDSKPAATSTAVLAHPPKVRAPSGPGCLAPKRAIRPELLDQYEKLTSVYRQLDYQAGSGAVYAEVVAQLHRMMTFSDDVPAATYRRFSLASGDSAQLAAWLAIDHQDYDAARRYAALALSSAYEAGDPTLRAYVLGIMAHIHLHAGRGPQAVHVLDAALEIAESPGLGVSGAVSSWLCEAMGEARALVGDRREGAASLARAESQFDAVEIEDVPSWLGFYNGIEHVARLRGRCLVRLGEKRAAVATLEDAISQLPAHYLRERSGTLIDLAAAQLLPRLAGTMLGADPEAAAATAGQAWDLAVQTGSGRNQRRVRDLLSDFAAYTHLPAYRELQDAMRQ